MGKKLNEQRKTNSFLWTADKKLLAVSTEDGSKPSTRSRWTAAERSRRPTTLNPESSDRDSSLCPYMAFFLITWLKYHTYSVPHDYS